MKKLTLSIISIFVLASIAGAQSLADVKKIDFANFTFVFNKKTVKMKDGVQDKACQEKDTDGIPTGEIWSLASAPAIYGDLTGDGRPEAIVALVANICSGNMVTDETVLVYTLKGGKPLLLPTFDYYDEGCKAGEKGCNFARTPGVAVIYNAREKALVVENSFATDDDALCCPSLFRQTFYKWNGTAFTAYKKGRITKREEK